MAPSNLSQNYLAPTLPVLGNQACGANLIEAGRAEKTCLLPQKFKRIACRLYWLCMKGFPEGRIIKLPRCLPAEKFPTFASGRQEREPVTLLNSHPPFSRARLRDVAQGESPAYADGSALVSSLGSPVIIVQVRSHSPDSGSFQY
jgi:hypothetical protein